MCRISQTAGKSDEWFPIIPGTDGMVVLAMAHVIANEGLWDKEFIERWTNTSPARLLQASRPLHSQKGRERERRQGLRYQANRRRVCHVQTEPRHRQEEAP